MAVVVDGAANPEHARRLELLGCNPSKAIMGPVDGGCPGEPVFVVRFARPAYRDAETRQAPR